VVVGSSSAVADVPAAWNEKHAEKLGVTPRNGAGGCPQEIRWSAGRIDYVPTYTVGNLLAAQLYAQAQADLSDLDQTLGVAT